jgi:hypothetical protein
VLPGLGVVFLPLVVLREKGPLFSGSRGIIITVLAVIAMLAAAGLFWETSGAPSGEVKKTLRGCAELAVGSAALGVMFLLSLMLSEIFPMLGKLLDWANTPRARYASVCLVGVIILLRSCIAH